MGFCLYFYGAKAFLYHLVQSLLSFSFAYLTQSTAVIWIVSVASMCTFGSSQAISQLVSNCILNTKCNYLFKKLICTVAVNISNMLQSTL